MSVTGSHHLVCESVLIVSTGGALDEVLHSHVQSGPWVDNVVRLGESEVGLWVPGLCVVYCLPLLYLYCSCGCGCCLMLCIFCFFWGVVLPVGE